MANNPTSSFISLVLLLILSLVFSSQPTSASGSTPRKRAPVEPQPLVLKYHEGPVLQGNVTINLIWYGKFSAVQRSIITDFIQSLSSPTRQPSVSSWWQITSRYRGLPCTLSLGKQILDERYSFGRVLKPSQLLALSSRLPHKNSINVVLTAADVAPDRFCMSACGAHASGLAGKHKKTNFVYAWVGNPGRQCPGQCAWPFQRPIYGPQTPPLVAPNGDVGVDGMIINLATVFAGAVTNPFNTGFFQGPADAPLEAVSACTGIFGSGAYPGYPGKLLVDKSSGASFNAYGIRGRKYLIPAIWDPKTAACNTPV